jgi:hypothetical protein
VHGTDELRVAEIERYCILDDVAPAALTGWSR